MHSTLPVLNPPSLAPPNSPPLPLRPSLPPTLPPPPNPVPFSLTHTKPHIALPFIKPPPELHPPCPHKQTHPPRTPTPHMFVLPLHTLAMLSCSIHLCAVPGDRPQPRRRLPEDEAEGPEQGHADPAGKPCPAGADPDPSALCGSGGSRPSGVAVLRQPGLAGCFQEPNRFAVMLDSVHSCLRRTKVWTYLLFAIKINGQSDCLLRNKNIHANHILHCLVSLALYSLMSYVTHRYISSCKVVGVCYQGTSLQYLNSNQALIRLEHLRRFSTCWKINRLNLLDG